MGHATVCKSIDRDEFDAVLTTVVQEYIHARRDKQPAHYLLEYMWADYYRTFNAVLYSIAARFRLNTDDAKDLLQEVWTQIICQLQADRGEVRGAVRLRAWLYTMIRNKALDFLRRNATRSATRADGAALAHLVDPSPGPADEAEQCWQRELVQRLLADLEQRETPENCRLIKLHYLESQSLVKTARALGLTIKQVRIREKKLLQRLRVSAKFFQGAPIGKS